MTAECSSKRCVSGKIPAELTLRSAVVDAVISVVLVGGAGVTDYIGHYFYPEGVPFPYSAILLARHIATLLWVIGSTLRYFRYAYREFSLTWTRVLHSKFWESVWALVDGVMGWCAKKWAQMDTASKYAVWMMVIVLLGLAAGQETGINAYFVVPVVYWGGAFGIAHIVGQKRKRVRERFWLLALLLFLLILATISVVGVDKIPILRLVSSDFDLVKSRLMWNEFLRICSLGVLMWWLYKFLRGYAQTITVDSRGLLAGSGK